MCHGLILYKVPYMEIAPTYQHYQHHQYNLRPYQAPTSITVRDTMHNVKHEGRGACQHPYHHQHTIAADGERKPYDVIIGTLGRASCVLVFVFWDTKLPPSPRIASTEHSISFILTLYLPSTCIKVAWMRTWLVG